MINYEFNPTENANLWDLTKGKSPLSLMSVFGERMSLNSLIKRTTCLTH